MIIKWQKSKDPDTRKEFHYLRHKNIRIVLEKSRDYKKHTNFTFTLSMDNSEIFQAYFYNMYEAIGVGNIIMKGLLLEEFTDALDALK